MMLMMKTVDILRLAALVFMFMHLTGEAIHKLYFYVVGQPNKQPGSFYKKLVVD